MKKIYLKPALESIVVTPLCAIQAASVTTVISGSDMIAGDNETAPAGASSLSKNDKGFDLWDE